MVRRQPPDLTVIARSRAGHAGLRCRLPLHLPALLLPRRHQGHGLEQPGVPQRRHAHRCGSCRASAGLEMTGNHGHEVKVFTGKWEQVTPAPMTPQDFDQAMATCELSTCSGWVNLPEHPCHPRRCGVLLFLLAVDVFALALNAAYWKTIK